MDIKQHIIAIAAIGKNRELGYKNDLLWDIPSDLAHFRKTTKGHPVIMGYKTYESIGRLLPKRPNIIMTLGNEAVPGARMAHSPEEAIALAESAPGSEKIFIIGGSMIYKIMLPYCDELMLTLVDDAPQADVFFPEYEQDFILKETSEPVTENGITFSFATFTRKTLNPTSIE